MPGGTCLPPASCPSAPPQPPRGRRGSRWCWNCERSLSSSPHCFCRVSVKRRFCSAFSAMVCAVAIVVKSSFLLIPFADQTTNELPPSLQTGLTQFADWIPVCKPDLCGVQSTNWTLKTSSLQTERRSLQTEPVRKLGPTTICDAQNRKAGPRTCIPFPHGEPVCSCSRPHTRHTHICVPWSKTKMAVARNVCSTINPSSPPEGPG